MTRPRLGSMRSMYQGSKSVRLHALASMHGGSMSATMHLLAGSDLRILDDIDAMGDLGIGDQVCVLRSNHALHHSHNTCFACYLETKITLGLCCWTLSCDAMCRAWTQANHYLQHAHAAWCSADLTARRGPL